MSGTPKHKHVIVIDDSQMDILLIKMIFESINYTEKLTIFQQAEEALDYFKEINPGKDQEKLPDIVFLDICMPGITGFEFLDKFNDLPEDIVKKTKFLIVSSSEDLSDMERSTKYPNVKGYMVKPLKKQQLLNEENL
ncbi:response regulator [Cytophagaceae bacterium ABcell3]|nr:response regulator [Cytophagaceae bacterium ABcell3]